MVVKMNDFESKRDVESQVSDMYTNMTNDDGQNFLDMATGLCCIMGNHYMQVLQVKEDLFMRFILREIEKKVGKHPLCENAWVLHYSEEVPLSNFKEYTIKQMNAQQATKQISNWQQFERVHHIYHAMVTIGDQVTNAIDAGKTQTQVVTLVKQ